VVSHMPVVALDRRLLGPVFESGIDRSEVLLFGADGSNVAVSEWVLLAKKCCLHYPLSSLDEKKAQLVVDQSSPWAAAPLRWRLTWPPTTLFPSSATISVHVTSTTS